jgi:microcystin-dependent protein
MNSNDGKQVLATKYIIRRIVTLLAVAVAIAVPAIFGAYSYERDVNDNHNDVGAESNSLSYSQVEPHVRAYVDENNAQSATEDSTSEAPAYAFDVAVGAILMYAGDETPDGFLDCDGREVSRSQYEELYATVGDKYGEGDGATTFNLPDMRAMIPVGAGDSGGIEDVGYVENPQSAELAFDKVSEPTGPPPVVDLDDERDAGEPESEAPDKGLVAVHYIIKF